MVKTPLVERDIESGRFLIEALDRAGFPLTAALWNSLPEESEWRLILATPKVKERGPREVYETVQRVIQSAEVDLPLHRISVVEPDDGLVTELRIFMGTDGAPFIGGTFLHGTMVGDAFVDAAYLYRAERIVGQSGIVEVTTGTFDRPRRVWVARHAKVIIENGFFKTIEIEGGEWPQTQTRDGISAHLDVIVNVERQGDKTLGDVNRWTILGGRLRGILNLAKGVRVEGDTAVSH